MSGPFEEERSKLLTSDVGVSVWGWRKWLPPLLLCAFVAGLGLLPHARFSREVGKLTYFKSAFDEDTYALWIFQDNGPAFPGRLLSRAALRAVFELTGHDWDRTEIVADLLFPAMAALIAWLVSCQVFRRKLARIVLTIGLLFSQELLSLGCSAVWEGRLNLGWVRAFAGRWERGLVPDYTTSYLSLFRTPEPQVSAFVFLGILCLLLRGDGGEPAGRRRVRSWLLAAAHGCLAFVNLFFAAAIVVLEGVLAVTLLALGRPSKALSAFGLSALGFTSIAVGSFYFEARGGTGDAAAISFRSHLPSITPSAVLAILCLCGVLMSLRSGARDHRLAMAIACFATVLVLTNQQVVSGRMISTRDWERYVDYSLLVLGVGLWASMAGSELRRRSAGVAEVVAIAALVLVARQLLRAQETVYRDFLRGNAESLAMERALREVEGVDVRHTTLVLANPALAPLLEFRMRGSLPCQIDYTELFERRVPSMAVIGGDWGVRSSFKGRLFEYFARLGRSPKEVATLLSSEVNQRAGFYLGFLFSMKDYWYPLTDDRHVRQEELRAEMPEIVADYEKYLVSEPASWNRPAIVLAEESSDRRVAPPFWEERLAARGIVGKGGAAVTVSAWLQTPRGQGVKPLQDSPAAAREGMSRP